MISAPVQKNLKLVAVMLLIGVVAWAVHAHVLLPPWIEWKLRRPVQEWMVVHGFGRFAGKAGILWLNLPMYCVALIAGMAIGRTRPREWLLCALTFGSAVFFADVVAGIAGGVWRIDWPNYWYVMIASTAYQFAVLPLCLAVAWLASRGGIRRAKRAAEGRCLNCGYLLRANESGKCPECGESVSRVEVAGAPIIGDGP